WVIDNREICYYATFSIGPKVAHSDIHVGTDHQSLLLFHRTLESACLRRPLLSVLNPAWRCPRWPPLIDDGTSVSYHRFLTDLISDLSFYVIGWSGCVAVLSNDRLPSSSFTLCSGINTSGAVT